MSKINCPYHQDSTASMELYEDGYAHCFGCSAHVAINELPGIHGVTLRQKVVEDLEKTLEYVDSLPIQTHRGLSFPTDVDGYYIIWPDRSFYNKRLFGAQRYKCAAGHVKRPFWARRSEESDTLLVVEGEINAMSVALVAPNFCDVVSPGGAGDFYSKSADKYLPGYLQYGKIILVADKDAAGAIACINLKANLVALGAEQVEIQLMEVDANEVLVKHGQETLKEKINKYLAMPNGLPNN